MILKAIDFFTRRTFLYREFVLENELKKAAVIRMLAGCFILVRFLEIFISQLYFDGFNHLSLLMAVFLLVSAFFTIGLCTPISNTLLIIFLPILDDAFSTVTLGSTIAINLLVVLLLVNSGYYYSADAELLKKRTTFSHLLAKTYSYIGIADNLRVNRAYFLGFILYAVNSIFASFLHFQDPDWSGGVTIRSMLSNSFMCKHALLLRDIEAGFPGVLSIFSVIGIVFQSAFQTLMIPLIFFKYGKLFVKVWGFTFFALSLFLLSLSYLPHLELLLWFLIFCSLNFPFYKVKVNSFRRDDRIIIKDSNTNFSKFVYLFYFVCLSLFVVMNNSYFADAFRSKPCIISLKQSFLKFSKHMGIEAPQVFNKVDLAMGDNFMTIKKYKDDIWQLTPITGENGERLNYLGHDILLFSNHNSDLIYLGQTLKYRRKLISESDNLEEFHQSGFGSKHIKFLLRYDYHKDKEKGIVRYKIEVFSSKSSKVSLFEVNNNRHKLQKVYEQEVLYDGNTVSK